MQFERRSREDRHPSSSINSEDLLVIKGFRSHLAAVAEPAVLDLLFLASHGGVRNKNVREAFVVRRAMAYLRLSRLTELGLLQKEGEEYKATEYACGLVRAISSLFQGAIKGHFMPDMRHQLAGHGTSGPDATRLAELCRIASENNEYLFNRGVIHEEERDRRQRLIEEVWAGLGDA